MYVPGFTYLRSQMFVAWQNTLIIATFGVIIIGLCAHFYNSMYFVVLSNIPARQLCLVRLFQVHFYKDFPCCCPGLLLLRWNLLKLPFPLLKVEFAKASISTSKGFVFAKASISTFLKVLFKHPSPIINVLNLPKLPFTFNVCIYFFNALLE